MKAFRKQTGLSQSEFADYYEIPVRTIQEWEQGRRTPPPYILKLLQRIWVLEKPTPDEIEKAKQRSIQKMFDYYKEKNPELTYEEFCEQFSIKGH